MIKDTKLSWGPKVLSKLWVKALPLGYLKYRKETLLGYFIWVNPAHL
jgi:hypothetical protein